MLPSPRQAETVQKVKLGCQQVEEIYTRYLTESAYKKNSICWKLHYLKYFLEFLDEDSDFRDLTQVQVQEFLEHLDEMISLRTKRPLAKRTKKMVFGVLKQLFRALYQQELVLFNPIQDMTYKAKGKVIQRQILSREEMGLFLDSIGEKRLRDRALFELLYSSGLRCGEAARLIISDIDFEQRMLLIREAKFGKDRIVPVSETAMKFLKRYLRGKRSDKNSPVFPGKNGYINKSTINKLFKNLLKEAGLYREGLSSHSIRHSIAVHLIANGLDLRFVQELLNHESIETTCTYTNDLVENIKRIYKTYAPRENEYYKEIDEEYLNRLETFREELIRQKQKREETRETKKRHYLKHKDKIAVRKKEWRNRQRRKKNDL